MIKSRRFWIIIILLLGAGDTVTVWENSPEREQALSHALLVAASSGHLEIVQAAVGQSMDLNAKDLVGHTSLMLACNRGHLDVVKLLLTKGADVNPVDTQGRTALIFALMGRSSLRVQLPRGNERFDIKYTVFEDTIDLKQYQRRTTPLFVTPPAKEGYLAIVGLLIQYNANVDVRDRSGNTA